MMEAVPTSTEVVEGEGAPDISIVNKEIAGRCKWEILEEMGSDHKPILITMKCQSGN